MSTPDTTIDARFSDPAATAAGWDETRRALEDAQLSWICTVRADGRPHLTPLVAVWLDGALYFTTGVHPGLVAALRAFSPPGSKVLLTTPTYNGFYGDLRNTG
ncbi:MAG: pyridoxamine 5'-phosphate oxidase family protein, partial [Streptosporangiaceae bacterium]